MTDAQRIKMFHDLKNDLTAMTALVNLHRLYKDDISSEEILNRLVERQTVISIAYEKLYQENNYPFIGLQNYINDLVQRENRNLSVYCSNIKITAETADLKMPIKRAIPFSQILLELISNSYRHAFKDGNGDKLIFFRIAEEDGLSLDYHDNGCGLPEGFNPKRTSTLGMQFISSLSRQLGGTPEFEETSQGMKFRLKII